MTSDFWNRLFYFMGKTKISLTEIIFVYVVSVILVILFFVLRFVIKELRKEHLSPYSNKKTRIQKGVEFFIQDYLQPVFTGTMDSDTKKLNRHFTQYEKLEEIVSQINLRDEDFGIKPIMLHMNRKYYCACIHLIVEKLLGEKIPQTSKEMSIDEMTKIHNVLAALYECNKNKGQPVELSYESGIRTRMITHSMIGVFFTFEYYLVLLMFSGAREMVLFLSITALFLMYLFRNRIKKIQIQVFEVFASFPYMIAYLILIVVLQHFGVIPVMFAR